MKKHSVAIIFIFLDCSLHTCFPVSLGIKKGVSKVVSNLEAGGTFLIPTEKQVIHALENRKRFLIANSESYGNKILFLVKSGRTNIIQI